jgi:hypothetical protein
MTGGVVVVVSDELDSTSDELELTAPGLVGAKDVLRTVGLGVSVSSPVTSDR